MNIIEIIGGTKKQRLLTEKVVVFCIKEMMPRIRTLDITVELKSKLDGDVDGYCWEGENNREHFIEICKKLKGDDEAEEIFNALYSNSIQISLKIIKAFGEDAVIIIETLLLSAYAFAETFSNPLISKLCIGIDESDLSIVKECSVIWPIPEGINNSKYALPGIQISLQVK